MKAYYRKDLIDTYPSPSFAPIYGFAHKTTMIDWNKSYECWQPDIFDCNGLNGHEDNYNMFLLIPQPHLNDIILIAVNTIDFEWEAL